MNEQATLGLVLQEIESVMLAENIEYEVIVSDNGSTDGSVDIANSFGARIVHVNEKGYGSALHEGILAANGNICVMFDADYTYDASYIPKMLNELAHNNYAMILGSRLNEKMEKLAMPFLHRYLGTPILTFLINRLYKGKITDCNSGMRMFYKDNYVEWGLKSKGMEYASEMIISSLLSGDTIAEIPINFRKDLRNKPPHLKRWNDGMRHLLFILSKAAGVFINIGYITILLTASLLMISLFGPYQFGAISIFGYHTMIFSILFGFLGAQSFSQGLILDINTQRNKVATWFLNIKESHLFWAIIFVLTVIFSSLVVLLKSWSNHKFQSLAYLNFSLFVVYFVTILGSITLGTFHAHIAKRN